VGFVRPSAGTNALIERTTVRDGSPASSTTATDAVKSAASLTSAGEALIDWPVTNRPPRAVARIHTDTVGGVTTADARVISVFERRWTFPSDSLRGADVIARWADGEPAAIEKSADRGCMRSVTIPVATVGDLAIRHDFVRLVSSISRPCARVTATIPADPSDVARLAGAGGLAPRAAFQSPTGARSPLAPWLLALAIAAAITEVLVRRRVRDTTLGVNKSSSPEARAA
jgi:hypothetical protein